jgi:hypothetical protein
VITRLREMQILTVPEYFEKRYGRSVRVVAGVLMAFGGSLNLGIFPIIEARFLAIVTGIPSLYLGWTMAALLLVALAYTALGSYYQALARKALGQTAEASALLDGLEQAARADTAESGDPRTRAVAYYLLSLVRREKGDTAGADADLAQARELDPHPGRRALTRAQIEYAGGHQ